MSTVIAIIYQNQFCLASDTKLSRHDDDSYNETIIKQIGINSALAIGFTGTALIAEKILESIKNWKNENCEEKVNSVRADDFPDDLTFYFDEMTSKEKEWAPIVPHSTALIIGLDRAARPTVIRWSSGYPRNVVHPSCLNNFMAIVLPPSDMDESECLKVAWELADNPEFDGSLKTLSADYIKIVASRSKFVNEEMTFWAADIPTL